MVVKAWIVICLVDSKMCTRVRKSNVYVRVYLILRKILPFKIIYRVSYFVNNYFRTRIFIKILKLNRNAYFIFDLRTVHHISTHHLIKLSNLITHAPSLSLHFLNTNPLSFGFSSHAISPVSLCSK